MQNQVDSYTFSPNWNDTKKLSSEELKFVEAWRGYLFTTGGCYSYKEMSKKLNISESRVSKILNSLKNKGFDLRRERDNMVFMYNDNGETKFRHANVSITIDKTVKKTPQKSGTELLEEVLKADPRKGAFIYYDLYNNRSKYGFTFSSTQRLYELAEKLVSAGKAEIINLYNPDSKNEKKIQQYIQLLKF